jgi:hypothetical protein
VWKLGEESVHVCVDNVDLRTVKILGKEYPTQLPRSPSADDIHMDWVSPVKGIDPATKRCDYAWGVSYEHWQQATKGLGAPVFTFSLIDGTIDDSQALAARARPDIADQLRDFRRRWSAVEKSLAVAGKPGYDKSMAYCEEYTRIVMQLYQHWAKYGAERQIMKAISDQIYGNARGGGP